MDDSWPRFMDESTTGIPAMPDDPAGFDAFISYRRSDGSVAAHWLRRNLERLRLPPELQRPDRKPLRCYIDVMYRRSTDDFFQKNIVPNLRASRYLVLVATPGVLQRLGDGQPNWVEREIAEFHATPQGANILIARAAGELGDPLPAVLSPDVAQRSDVADLRGLSWRRRMRRPRPAYPRDELLTIAAALYGITEQEMPILRREEERLRRARARQRLLVTTVLMVLFAGLFIWAARGSIAARRELLRNHVAQGALYFPERPAHARLHFARATELARLRLAGVTVWRVDDRLARQWLAEWRGEAPPAVSWLQEGEDVLDFSPDGRVALVQRMEPGAQEGFVRLLRLDTGERIPTSMRFSTSQRAAGPPEFSRDGSVVLYGGRIFRTASGAEIRVPEPRDMIVKARVLSPDGTRLLLAARRLELYSLRDGRLLRRSVQREGDFWRAAFTPDGRSIITIDHRGTGEVWDAETLQDRGVRQADFGDVDVPADFDEIPPEDDFDPPDAAAPVVSPDGQWVASDAPGGIRISRMDGLRLETTLPVQLDRTLAQMRFSADSERFLVVEQGGGVASWLLPAVLYRHFGFASPVLSAFWVPGADEVATIHADHGIRRSAVVRGFRVGKPGQHGGAITAARLVDGGTLLTASADGTVRRWTLRDASAAVDLGEQGAFVTGFDADEGRLRFWSPARSAVGDVRVRAGPAEPRVAMAGALAPVVPLARSGDGRILVGRIPSGEFVVVDVEARRFFPGTFPPSPGCTAEPHLVIGVSHGGTGFATWCDSVGVEWRRLPGGERIGPPLRLARRPFAGVLSDDLRTAWLMTRGELLRMDPRRPSPVRVPDAVPALMPRTLAFSRDGRKALVSIHVVRPGTSGTGGIGEEAGLRVYDARTGRPASALMLPADRLAGAALSPDGRLVVSCGVRLQAWDAGTGTPIGAPGRECVFADEILVGPGGTVAITHGQGTRVELADLRPATETPDVLRRNAEAEGLLRLDPATGAIQPLSRREWEALQAARPR